MMEAIPNITTEELAQYWTKTAKTRESIKDRKKRIRN
jgi:hypothetical protein